MLQLDRHFPRRKSDIKLRTALVVWLGVGSSLTCLVLAYAFYMRYREQPPPSNLEAIGAIVRSGGYACTQVCALDRSGPGDETAITCGTTAGATACTNTVRYTLSVARSPRQP